MGAESKDVVKNEGENCMIGKGASWRETKECPLKYSKNETGNSIISTVNISSEVENRRTPEQYYKQAICELTGTANEDLANHIILNGALSLTGSKKPESHNIISQALAEYQPRDQHEARLCVQSTALYDHGMNYLFQLNSNKNLAQSEFYLKNAIKLLRLHNETIEALGKYRRGGTQNVIVQHVQVNDGGKAIVGNMIAG